jgi:hypothetical protein
MYQDNIYREITFEATFSTNFPTMNPTPLFLYMITKLFSIMVGKQTYTLMNLLVNLFQIGGSKNIPRMYNGSIFFLVE